MTDRSPSIYARDASNRCVRGTYIPSSQVVEVTKSLSFTKPSRVLACFSFGNGTPEAVQAGDFAQRRLTFGLGDVYQRSDIFTQSTPVHSARTVEKLLALLKTSSGGPNRPNEMKIRTIRAPRSGTRARSTLAQGSFARTTYWGVHAFPATNARGETRFIKFKVEPVAAKVDLVSVDRRKAGDFADDDLELRIAARDVRFSLTALLDRPGDPVTDVTMRWPDEDEREAVRLGTLVITGVEPTGSCDQAAFNPANLAEGIGYPPDAMFAARFAAYAALRP